MVMLDKLDAHDLCDGDKVDHIAVYETLVVCAWQMVEEEPFMRVPGTGEAKDRGWGKEHSKDTCTDGGG